MAGAIWRAVGAHWPEYAMEAAGLGLFMVSACAVGTLVGHPRSPVVEALPSEVLRRLAAGIAMGLTAIALISSPWGQRSGAHLNPATTLTFWRLGKVAGVDAAGYAVAQALGGLVGVLVSAAVLGGLLADPGVRYVATIPGPRGVGWAFAAELLISLLLMTVVLRVSNAPRFARLTPLVVGGLVAAYITVEAPLSGMSMNPARSLASAVPAGEWTGFWIYLVAPPLGMLAAAEAHARTRGLAAVFCAKLHHANARRCIFHCRHAQMKAHDPILTPSKAPRAA